MSSHHIHDSVIGNTSVTLTTAAIPPLIEDQRRPGRMTRVGRDLGPRPVRAAASLPVRPPQLPRGDQPTTTGRAHDPRPPCPTGPPPAPVRVAVAPRRLAAGRPL